MGLGVLKRWDGSQWVAQAGDQVVAASSTVNIQSVSGTGTLTFATDANQRVEDVTMTGDTTFSFAGIGSSGTVSTMTLELDGAFVPTFPASVIWDAGSPPTYTTPSVFTFFCIDGSTVYGFAASIGAA